MTNIDVRRAPEERMLREAKSVLRSSGDFRTAQSVAVLFGQDLADGDRRLAEWTARRELFSIEDDAGSELFPVFAFDRSCDFRPFTAVAQVLETFGNRLSIWGVASWFIGANSFLDDQCPKDLIEEDPEWVVEVARDGMNEILHG